jgi:hypothetical protein
MVKMVEVVVRDPDGRVVNRITANEELFNYVLERVRGEQHDMGTAWFGRILAAIFGSAAVGGSVTATYTDSSGTLRTQYFKTAVGTFSDFLNTGSCANALYIGYGSSSATPTRTDYVLGNKLGEVIAGVAADDVNGIVTISASFTMNTNTTIYEVSLEWYGAVASYNVCGRVLLDRTVFPNGIPVSAGQTISIAYRFILP